MFYYSKKLILYLIVLINLTIILLLSKQVNKVTRNDQTDDSNNFFVTVVSMYFSLDKSKHSQSEYDTWIKNFMKSVDTSLVLFCDRKSLDKLRMYRENKPVKFYVYESIWDIMRALEVYRNMSYVDNYKNKQLDLDREKNIHNPNLYAIWNLKTFILKLVADENPFKSEYFIYTDAGAWRQGVFENWPDENFIYRLIRFQQNRILFGQISDNLNDLERNDIIEGTFFSGNKVAVDQFYKNYYAIHDRRLKEGLFVGKDQILMNLLAFCEFNETVVKLRTWDIKCNLNIHIWFFYQYFFAQKKDFKCLNNRFSLLS
jgi:hypothetical protein